MTRQMTRLVVALAAIMAPAYPTAAQGGGGLVVRGIVVEPGGKPVSFAVISAEGVGERIADDSGRFLVALPRSGPVRFRIRRLGFHPTESRAVVERDTALRFVLQPLPASLAKVQIEAEATTASLELGGFYSRLREKERGANTGHFILPEEIEQRRGAVTSVVTGIPGLRVERYKPRGPFSSEYMALMGNARKISGNGLCPMTVYLDRVRLQPPGGALGHENALPVDVNEVVTLRDVAGIEVYTRSNTPFEFAMLNGTCGVVLIWTK